MAKKTTSLKVAKKESKVLRDKRTSREKKKRNKKIICIKKF